MKRDLYLTKITLWGNASPVIQVRARLASFPDGVNAHAAEVRDTIKDDPEAQRLAEALCARVRAVVDGRFGWTGEGDVSAEEQLRRAKVIAGEG